MEEETEGSGDEEEQETKVFSLNMIPLVEKKVYLSHLQRNPRQTDTSGYSFFL